MITICRTHNICQLCRLVSRSSVWNYSPGVINNKKLYGTVISSCVRLRCSGRHSFGRGNLNYLVTCLMCVSRLLSDVPDVCFHVVSRSPAVSSVTVDSLGPHFSSDLQYVHSISFYDHIFGDELWPQFCARGECDLICIFKCLFVIWQHFRMVTRPVELTC